jgi:hypothetical protein
MDGPKARRFDLIQCCYIGVICVSPIARGQMDRNGAPSRARKAVFRQTVIISQGFVALAILSVMPGFLESYGRFDMPFYVNVVSGSAFSSINDQHSSSFVPASNLGIASPLPPNILSPKHRVTGCDQRPPACPNVHD